MTRRRSRFCSCWDRDLGVEPDCGDGLTNPSLRRGASGGPWHERGAPVCWMGNRDAPPLEMEPQRWLVAWWQYSDSKFIVIDAVTAQEAQELARNRLRAIWKREYGCPDMDDDDLPDYPVEKMEAKLVRDLEEGEEVWGRAT